MSALEKILNIQQWFNAGYSKDSQITIIVKPSPILDIKDERIESFVAHDATDTLKRRSVWSGMLSFRPWANYHTSCIWLFTREKLSPSIPKPNMSAQFGPYIMYMWLLDAPPTFIAWQRAMMGLDKVHGGKPRWFNEESTMLMPGSPNWKGNPPTANDPVWHHENRYAISEFPVHVPAARRQNQEQSKPMSSHFPPAFVDEVSSRTDLIELIGRHVQLKKAGSNMMGLCPFHHEKSPSFSVSPDKQLYYCFGCGKGGGAYQFLMEHDGYSFPEAVEYLAEKAGMEIPKDARIDSAKAQQQSSDLLMLAQASALFVEILQSEQGNAAQEYLRKRGLPEPIIERYGIGFAPSGYNTMRGRFAKSSETMEQIERVGLVFKNQQGGYGDRFRERVMFPVRNKRGQVVGFGGRIIGDDTPKYLNSPETAYYHKSELLYGYAEHRDEIRRRKLSIIVEGYMDVLSLAAYGLPIALAPNGTAITEHQVRDILRLHDAPIFCFDGDKAGRNAAWRALEKMIPIIDADHGPRFLYLPEGEDPDSLLQSEGPEAFISRIKEDASPILDTWLAGLKAMAGQGAEGRARMAKKADAMLSIMNDTYLKQVWRQEAERCTGLSLQHTP